MENTFLIFQEGNTCGLKRVAYFLYFSFQSASVCIPGYFLSKRYCPDKVVSLVGVTVWRKLFELSLLCSLVAFYNMEDNLYFSNIKGGIQGEKSQESTDI